MFEFGDYTLLSGVRSSETRDCKQWNCIDANVKNATLIFVSIP